MLEILLVLLAVLASGMSVALYFQRRKAETLQAQLQTTEQEKQQLASEKDASEKKLIELQTLHKAGQEKEDLLIGAMNHFKAEFENLSTKIYEDRSEKFKGESTELLKTMLDPLNKQIAEFSTNFTDTRENFVKKFGELQGHIHIVQGIGEQAQNLTDALKGNAKYRGDWGEMVLEKVLEASGFREGETYRRQVTLDDEGQRKIPDIIVDLPGERHIVIDSKLSLVSYTQYCADENEAESEMHLKKYVQAVEEHIKDLSNKAYQQVSSINSPDYVLMFIPIEPAYILAIESGILDKAFRKNIMLVSPSTLLAALRTVGHLWEIERQNRNAQTIAQEAGKMYDKFVTFTEALLSARRGIDRAGEEYDRAYKLLKEGKGNLVGRAEKLKTLGVSPSKSLPEKVLSDSEAHDSLAEHKELPEHPSKH